MKHLLLVEDEETDVFLFRRALIKAEIDVTLSEVDNGRAAIEFLGQTGEFAGRPDELTPDLVLLDLHIPFVNGLDVLRWIRQNRPPSLPVVILTASQSEPDLKEAYNCGANSFLVKPTSLDGLIELVGVLCSYWLRCNRSPRDLGRESAAKEVVG
jgi:CheY-like chemotaxis protein